MGPFNDGYYGGRYAMGALRRNGRFGKVVQSCSDA
jgi:hypothetical protein